MSKRIRTIKPALWEDAKLGRLDAVTRLTYLGLICMANDYGKFRADAEGVKAFVHARDRGVSIEHVEAAIERLVEKGFVELYGDEDEWFGRFPGGKFGKHQRIDRPGRDDLPDPSPKYPKRRGFVESSTTLRASLDEHSTGEGKRKGVEEVPIGTLSDSGKPNSDRATLIRSIYQHWCSESGKPNRKLTNDRRSRINARLSEGYTPDEIKQAITNGLRDPFLQGDNPRRKVYDDIATLIGSAEKLERYRDAAIRNPTSAHGLARL